jgi:hypothetical protein
MPHRASTVVLLALTQSQAARAFGVRPERIRAACDAGELVCRQLPGSSYKRIPVFGEHGLQQWFDSWPLANRKVPQS